MLGTRSESCPYIAELETLLTEIGRLGLSRERRHENGSQSFLTLGAGSEEAGIFITQWSVIYTHS